MSSSSEPRPDDPYRKCAVYLEHGACVCSTGYPASCTAEQEVAAATGVSPALAAFALGYCDDDVTAATAALWSTDE